MAEYIEREAAEKVAEKYGCTNGSTIGIHSGLADCIAFEIAKIPAADVEPVRHGRWVMTVYVTTSKRGRVISNKKFSCSECGYGNGRKTSNFCPNCGCKMDLEG